VRYSSGRLLEHLLTVVFKKSLEKLRVSSTPRCVIRLRTGWTESGSGLDNGGLNLGLRILTDSCHLLF
jgi:hypothetical protein